MEKKKKQIMQEPLSSKKIITFLRKNIEPLNDSVYGDRYRASVYLTDGTYLPCVVFRNSSQMVNLAIRRFKEEQSGKGIFGKGSVSAYHNIVKHFVTAGNRVNGYEIAKVEKSPFALPVSILRKIEGETTMGWTCFVAKMKDSSYVGLGTTFHMEFFDFPEGYTAEDITEIINHSYITESGKIQTHRNRPFIHVEEEEEIITYREKPFFDCFLDDLDVG